MMNPHVYLLGFLIGSSGLESAFSFSLRPTPPLCSTSSNLVSQQQQPHPLVAQPLPLAPHHDHRQNHRCCALSTPTTVLQARRGGRGRRRGRTEYDDDAAATTAVKEKPAQQQRQGAAGEATLAVQHAADEELLKVAHDHLAVLRPGVLSQALLRIAKHMVQEAKKEARNKLLKDPRLLELFMAASAPAAATNTNAGERLRLSAPQVADIVWACGLLRWRPSDEQRLGQLIELVAKAASSGGGLDGWHVTNVVWALDRLGSPAPAAAGATAAAAREEPAVLLGGENRGTVRGFGGAVEELRERVARLPFRAIPSLFDGLRVEDFRKEVAFGRDEILLGGGKVLSESRLTAWQSSDGLPFAYSGKVMEPLPFSPNVLRLRDALYERTGVLYDGVLLNLYESRSSAMRYHSDPDVGTVWTEDTSVVSVGDTRQFALRKTLDHTCRHAFYLSSGDCVRMTAGCQHEYQHCVKVAKDEVGPRVSLVFKQSIAGVQHPKE